MNRHQIEQLYILNGLKDFKLTTINDIKKIYGRDPREIEGHKTLDDINRNLYNKFIVNFYNGLGLESRNTLIPKTINYVKHIEHLGKEYEGNEYYDVLGATVTAIYNNGKTSVIRTWVDEDYKHLKTLREETSYYLRFEYEHQDRKEWLHVITEDSWY